MSAQRYIVRKQRQWHVVRDTAFRPSDFVEKFETREAAQFHANDLNERDAAHARYLARPEVSRWNFEGHSPRECGDHRTVGPHRAWCHDCAEWCYPDDGCKGCQLGSVAALVAAAEERGAAKEQERLAEEVAMVETWRAAVVGMARRLHEIEQQVEPADAAAEYLDALERSTDSPRLKAAVQSVRRGSS